MTDRPELHDELGALLGFTLATAQLVRRAAALADQENERDLLQVLQRLDSAAAQVQRGCQVLVARHPRLRPGRITATSRKIKVGIMGCCHQEATVRDLLELLTMAVNRARVSAVAMTALYTPDNDPAIAGFVGFVISIQEGHTAAISNACSRLGPLSSRATPSRQRMLRAY